MYTLIIAAINNLIKSDWYNLAVTIFVPCTHCTTLQRTTSKQNDQRSVKFQNNSNADPDSNAVGPKEAEQQPYMFSLEACQSSIFRGESFIDCLKEENGSPVRVRLDLLVPDIALSLLSHHKITYSDLKIEKKIGEGAFADVFKGNNDRPSLHYQVVPHQFNQY